MRCAVFTNQFPSQISTFFARDMRGLINAGVDVDIFPFYPLEPDLWRYVPQILSDVVLPRNKIHHMTLTESLRHAGWPDKKLLTFSHDIVPICLSAAKFGADRLAKTIYVLLKALSWARLYNRNYDHILAYWGNYAATCAYIFHRIIDRAIPFSMFLHAGMDLYEGQVYMREKLLYADNIIVVCDFNRRFLHEHFNDIFPQISAKITKHHLGLDFAEFRYEPDGRSKRKILAVGGLYEYKGFDYLLRAGHVLSSRGLDYEIELVGDGPEANSLKRLAADLKIEQRVKFMGWLPPSEVRTTMNRATTLVHPSNGLGDAVPTVIKEAMATGLPVIASDVAGIPELLDNGNCGILVPPRNVEALASAIEKLLMNSELCRSYAESGRRYATEQFDLWRNGHHLADLLRSTTRLQPNH